MNNAMTKAIVRSRLPARRQALGASGGAGAAVGETGRLTEAMRRNATARAGNPISRRRSVGVRDARLLRLGDAEGHGGVASLVGVLVAAVREVEVELVDAAGARGERV